MLKEVLKARKFIYAKKFDGMPKQTDFKMVEENLPAIKEGEFLAEAVYLSVDPYMRAYASNSPIGTTMVGTQIAKIIESKNKNFPVDKYVVARFGWRDYTVYSEGGAGEAKGPYTAAPYLIPDFKDLPLSFALGVLGMPGNTAYFALMEICKPKAGETIVISGAAGAVGSHVGQIAKILGCKVIGIAGSDDKGNYLLKNLDFDAFINYKTDNVDEKLSEIAPKGVDCYFDNVAGEVSTAVMNHMNKGGRVSLCGTISYYNSDENNPPKVTVRQPVVLRNQLKIKGYQNSLYQDRIFESMQKNLEWIQDGKLKYHETITKGFENMPKAFIEMLMGKNLGKAVVKV